MYIVKVFYRQLKNDNKQRPTKENEWACKVYA